MSATGSPWTAARRADAEAREAAQRQFEAPLAIEAGAGTGKTATLVARVLAWALGPGWERVRSEDPEADDARTAERVLRGVVAITFTEAAAAEMDARIEAGLAELAGGGAPAGFDAPAPAERVVALRAALDHLVVQTIHAWCRRLLASHPLEAGVHPLFEVDSEGTAREEAVREIAAERLGAGYLARDPALLALAERGVGPGEIEHALTLQLAAGVTAQELGDDLVAPSRIEALCTRLRSAHAGLSAAAGGALASVSRSKRGLEVESALARAVPLLDAPVGDPAGLARLCEGLIELWQGTARNALGSWSRGSFNRGEEAALGARCEAIREAAAELAPMLRHVESLDPESLALLAPVLAELAREVEERLRRSGQIGFDGLLRRTAELLERRDVAARVRANIDQLLVDEFQDTDPRQCAIVARLALEGSAESRPGLFVVGDPKQSIYGWRSADLAAYEGLLDRIRAAGGRVLPLCVNHRSVPAILAAVERVVAPVMHREAQVQPAFQPLAPSEKLEAEAGFRAEGRAPLEVWIPAQFDEEGQPRQTRALDAARLEARALARDLRGLHDAGELCWGDVGVLFRSRGEWDVYLGALREAGIPFRVEGDRSYYRRREILDAAALLCAALDPNDMLALLTVLRSSAAGVPDAAWIPLWEGRFPALAARLGEDPDTPGALRALLARVSGELDPELPGLARIEGWHEAAALCLEAVAALRASASDEAGDRFVERLRCLSAFEGVEATRFLGRWRSANLERFFIDRADQLAAAGSTDAALRAIRRAVAEEELPSAEPALLDASDAVSVVTLHGAKGLAWKHVYLMQLHKGEPTGNQEDEAGWIGGRLEGRCCKWPTPGRDLLEQRRSRVADAERVRTLYVGMTRAKRRLVLSGLWPELQKGGRTSHAGLLAEGAGAGVDLGDLVRGADAEGRLEREGWSWVFPARAADAGTPLAEPPAPPAESAPGRDSRIATAPDPAAWLRAARRRSVAVSRLAEISAEEEGRAAAPAQPGSGFGPQVGTVIHAALERLDLAAPPAEEWSRQAARIEADLRARVPASRVEAAVADALSLWERLAQGPIATRLRSLAERVVARELPLLLPLSADPVASLHAEHASGAIDLLYRDEDGRLVVADYKTDQRAEAAPDPKRLAAYARQGALYCRAVAEALDEPAPRFELWWLRNGEVESIPDA